MKNIAYAMLLLMFVIIVGLNTPTYAQTSTAERREIDEERRSQQEERRMSTAERRELERERQERREQIHRDLEARREQREQERQQQREQARERNLPSWVQRDIQEERRSQQEERRMSTAERYDLQQERRERREQMRREWQARREQWEHERRQRLHPQQSFGNPAPDTEAKNYYGVELNEAERRLYRRDPQLAMVVRGIREHANSVTSNRFPNMAPRNTPADAFRHAYASALLARELGWRGAKHVTDLHEMTIGNSPQERAMDLHNNAVGIGIGSTLVRDRYGVRQMTDAEIVYWTEQALREGQLVYLRSR